MFESNREKNAEITLCIFPHLKEFLAIDARDILPEGPVVRSLTIDQVLDEEFMAGVEADFSKIMRREDLGFLGLMGMPQEIEALIRTHALRKVVEYLTEGLEEASSETVGSVGVLFFTGQMLNLERDQFEQATRELFGQHLTPGQIDELVEKLDELIDAERAAEKAVNKSDIARLITGDGGPYVTIWENEGN